MLTSNKLTCCQKNRDQTHQKKWDEKSKLIIIMENCLLFIILHILQLWRVILFVVRLHLLFLNGKRRHQGKQLDQVNN